MNKKIDKPWIHGGGGVLFATKDKFCADDQYEHARTKKRITVVCTVDAHFCMPDRVRRPSDLARRAGVKSVKPAKDD